MQERMLVCVYVCVWVGEYECGICKCSVCGACKATPSQFIVAYPPPACNFFFLNSPTWMMISFKLIFWLLFINKVIPLSSISMQHESG